MAVFLSTPPSRVATAMQEKQVHTPLVSIHATLAGGDSLKHIPILWMACFYPRHPRGWRRICLLGICDLLCSFYPRHPRGWRLCSSSISACDSAVSIHATLAGGDTFNIHIVCLLHVSIHATLAGGDMALWAEYLDGIAFLSTPPSRVATEISFDMI